MGASDSWRLTFAFSAHGPATTFTVCATRSLLSTSPTSGSARACSSLPVANSFTYRARQVNLRVGRGVLTLVRTPRSAVSPRRRPNHPPYSPARCNSTGTPRRLEVRNRGGPHLKGSTRQISCSLNMRTKHVPRVTPRKRGLSFATEPALARRRVISSVFLLYMFASPLPQQGARSHRFLTLTSKNAVLPTLLTLSRRSQSLAHHSRARSRLRIPKPARCTDPRPPQTQEHS